MNAPVRILKSPPRRYEALAFIIERIARTGVSPSLEEIAAQLALGKTRTRELIDQLVAEGMLERVPGAVRNLRVRDVAGSRVVLAEALRRLGWSPAAPMGELHYPRPDDRVPVLPAFEHIPDVD